MKLKVFNFETVLKLNVGKINIVEIEDIRLFRKVVETIRAQQSNLEVEEKVYIYDEGFNEFNYSKTILILDFLDLISNLKTNTTFFSIIDAEADELKEEAIQLINTQLNEFASKILYDIDIDLSYQESYSIRDLLRIIKIKVNDTGNILENLFTLIDFYSLLDPGAILFLVNLKSYLDSKELSELYKYILGNNLNIVLLERSGLGKTLKYEQKLHIDKTFDDHFELHTYTI